MTNCSSALELATVYGDRAGAAWARTWIAEWRESEAATTRPPRVSPAA